MKPHFRTLDIALVSVFCALWIVLNYVLGPFSFQLLGLPVFHDFAVFFTLLMVTWTTGRFGTSLLVGIVGSPVAVLLAPQIAGPMVGFSVSALVFDMMMSANHHKIRISVRSLTIAVIATVMSAFVAGLLIGLFFTPSTTFETALTFWGAWHVIGAIFTLVITLPMIAGLEKSNVRVLVDGG